MTVQGSPLDGNRPTTSRSRKHNGSRMTTSSQIVIAATVLLCAAILIPGSINSSSPFTPRKVDMPVLSSTTKKANNDESISSTSPLLSSSSLLVSKLSADMSSSKVLNVHVVPHTHDDVGWLKTVDQYYFGLNESIQQASVHEIIDSVIASLSENPSRTFTYVEQKFFSMWWNQQKDVVRDIVRLLIANQQLNFVNGGWCMHDEAATHFMGMIDQTTLGHSFLKRELGVVPKVGWQLDPFGHSATQASLMTSKMGFDALYFGRIDYQDLMLRKLEQECEGLWNSSTNLNETTIYWGLTGSHSGMYGAPSGFCFDAKCGENAVSLIGLNASQLEPLMKDFLRKIRVQSEQTKGGHVMLTMGEDFQYRMARINFASMDALIGSVLDFQAQGIIDIPFMLGPRFDSVNIFYSSPEYYTECKYKEIQASRQRQRHKNERDDVFNAGSNEPSSQIETKTAGVEMSIKTDDFFPYSDCEHCFWTGYYTSRANLKRFERVASSFMLSTRQIESMLDVSSVGEGDAAVCEEFFHELEDAVGVIQHHDGVSGTSKQHVAYDYAHRVQKGINSVTPCTLKKLKRLFLGVKSSEDYWTDLSFCQLLNETICDISQQATTDDTRDLYVIVYNGLASLRGSTIQLPVSSNATYRVARLDVPTEQAQFIRSTPSHHEQGYFTNGRDLAAKYVLSFDTGLLPPVGAAVFQISTVRDYDQRNYPNFDLYNFTSTNAVRSRVLQDALLGDHVEVNNGEIAVRFDRLTGSIKQITSSNTTLDVNQTWGYYTSFDSKIDGIQKDQNSGAYIFRPSTPEQSIVVLHPKEATFVSSSVGTEVHVTFDVPWLRTTTRVLVNTPHVEVEYTVGPIDIADGRGKEIVTRFSTSLQTDATFYTDSNGREFLKRRRNYRPTWNLNVFEPVAGNYYPVNTAIYMEDAITKKALAVVVDRTSGGSSLEDGSVEVMVQRRIISDDGRGVDEALNETSCGITPEPPFGNATRLGDGIVMTGKHRILVGSHGGASLARSAMDGAFVDPLVFVASAPTGQRIPIRVANISAIQGELPSNVMLITLARLYLQEYDPDAGMVFLIRLGHQYAVGEDESLSKPVKISLESILVGYKIVSVREKTLSGNQDYSSWLERRFDWRGEGGNYGATALEGTIVTLNPMDILTFEVVVQPMGL